MDEQKPGDVISPRASQEGSNEVSVQIPRDAPTIAQPAPPAVPQPETVLPEPPVANDPMPSMPVSEAPVLPQPQDSAVEPLPLADIPAVNPSVPQPFAFNADDTPPEPNPENLSWTASEFIHHAKSLNWYLVVGIVGLVGAVIVYFWTKDIISTAVIAGVAVIFAVSATSKPRVLPYEINESGIQIGSRHYPYADFKTFSVVREGSAFSKVELMPLKRFSPPVSMHFPPEEEDTIVHTLSEFLPYEEHKPDATERLLDKIRF